MLWKVVLVGKYENDITKFMDNSNVSCHTILQGGGKILCR